MAYRNLTRGAEQTENLVIIGCVLAACGLVVGFMLSTVGAPLLEPAAEPTATIEDATGKTEPPELPPKLVPITVKEWNSWDHARQAEYAAHVMAVYEWDGDVHPVELADECFELNPDSRQPVDAQMVSWLYHMEKEKPTVWECFSGDRDARPFRIGKERTMRIDWRGEAFGLVVDLVDADTGELAIPALIEGNCGTLHTVIPPGHYFLRAKNANGSEIRFWRGDDHRNTVLRKVPHLNDAAEAARLR